MKNYKGILVAVIGLALGAIAGGALTSMSSAAPEQVSVQSREDITTIEQLAAQTGLPAESFVVKTNEAGQTYGSGLVSLIEGQELPDLVRVYMDDGQVGYVKSADLVAPPPSSPEEAIRMMEQQSRNAQRSSPTILVATDEQGNPIGTFTSSNR